MVDNDTATPQQEESVAEMIRRMKNPLKPPTESSFTMGWDVVANYSERQINQLLEDRHKAHAQDSGMLHELVLDIPEKDKRTKKMYMTHWRINFGKPLLQFDPKATTTPACSLRMTITSGTVKYGDDAEQENLEPGWSLELNNIPLATVRGTMSSSGHIDSKEELIAGSAPVHFDYNHEQTQYVVLGFNMDPTKVVVRVVPPEGWNADLDHPVNQSAFLDLFKAFFTEPVKKKDETGKVIAEIPRAFSYPIASVNNKYNEQGIELRPEKFQFATYFGEGEFQDIQVLSIFIQVKGGTTKGDDVKLQERWTSQWFENKTVPIPKGFSASLIFSSRLFTDVIMKQGFERSGWTLSRVDNTDTKKKTLNKIECRSSSRWKVPQQEYEYGMTSLFHVDGFDISLRDYPLYLTIEQEDFKKSPQVYGHWLIERTIAWSSAWKTLGIADREVHATGNINASFRLCDTKDFSEPRKLETSVVVDDESFALDLKLDKIDASTFRMDQKEPNEIHYDTWHKGMEGLWTKAPQVSVSSFGIGFLRTTNLLMPGERVIDINSKIGLRAPKDIVLVGDVVQA